MVVNGDVRAGLIRSQQVPWDVDLTDVHGPIELARRSAEKFRVQFESFLDDIGPDDLRQRLLDFRPARWDDIPDLADEAHRSAWEDIRNSGQLRDMAADGYRLYRRFFPDGSQLRQWLDELEPGSRLQLNFAHAKLDVGTIPWGLMYSRDPDAPLDPMGFLGLRLRIAIAAWQPTAPVRRDLGAPDRSWRAHCLYWGADDSVATEASWQRSSWAGELNQVFVPDAAGPGAKAALLTLLHEPAPRPLSVLYLFCRASSGSGEDPVLRFGSMTRPDDVITRNELPTRQLEDRPLVFANACTTAASDPLYTSELARAFADRGCRAFIGTETKVPVVLASRCASLFFHFFGRHVDGTPMAAGEALAQTRLFLWSHYRNLGGLFYTYFNEYELFLADETEIALLAP